MSTKYIFVTGGVVSSIGKGIVAASLGRLLKNRGLKVTIQKFDPYINIDPGTMSPYQHGEVFVTDDGAETDLDLGHYERFIDINLNKYSNVTTGKIYSEVLRKERKGEYLGATVQVIPHITDALKDKIKRAARTTDSDVIITEVGGTVGDIESLPFRSFTPDEGGCRSRQCHVYPYDPSSISQGSRRNEDQADSAFCQRVARSGNSAKYAGHSDRTTSWTKYQKQTGSIL